MTEDTAALHFLATYGARLRYCHDHRAWFVWNGNTWRKNTSGLALHLARGLAREISRECDNSAKLTAGRASFASNIEALARVDPAFVVGAECWDHDPFLLGTPAGTVDL